MNDPKPRKYSYTAVGMVIGTAVALGLGLVLWLATGQLLFLLMGTMGTGIGLALGAAIDATDGDRSREREGAPDDGADGRREGGRDE